MIESGLSIKQNFPRDLSSANGARRIGDLPYSAVALKDVPYDIIYEELESHHSYHIKLPDGGLIVFQYEFEAYGLLAKHRLAYFPSPVLPTIDEAPDLYARDELYADILSKRLVRFPIRFDFDPDSHKDVLHPKCHMTLGQFEGCRIPVVRPVMPNAFLLFLLRNFYCRSYIRFKNRFDKKLGGESIGRRDHNSSGAAHRSFFGAVRRGRSESRGSDANRT
jgi:hypothetical protein